MLSHNMSIPAKIKIMDKNRPLEYVIDNPDKKGDSNFMLARGFVLSNNYGQRFTLISAMHKEIRRGDAQKAYHFANLVSRAMGARYISNYVRNIVFEETRNYRVLDYIGKHHLHDVVTLASSVKKWESPNRVGHIVKKSECYVEAVKLGPLPLEEVDSILCCSNYYEAFTQFMRIMAFNKKDEIYRLRLKELVTEKQPNNPILKHFLGAPSRYQSVMMLEYFYNFLVPEELMFYNVPEIKVDDHIKTPQLYCFDIHTRAGYKNLLENWDKIQPNTPLPECLDLRWSGCVLSTLWREKAFEQFGQDYRNVKWEDVKIDLYEWNTSKYLDAHHYASKIYSKCEKNYVIGKVW